MKNWSNLILICFCLICLRTLTFGNNGNNCCNRKRELASWFGSWRTSPTTATWTLQTRIPMTTGFNEATSRMDEARGKIKKFKKKFKRFLLPLLLAYKLKFFTLIPVMIGGLILLTGATGLAGFFFALFAAVMGLKGGGGGAHH